MSSLAAAQADGFYHPPDWDPRKKSRGEHAAGVSRKEDKWKGHPLRERAKKLATEGILTIRFEMPFNVRCSGCDNQIAKGVRFNAEKKTIGQYLSSNIYSFRMMCHCEDGTSRTDRRRNPHWIEIHTDPKNAEYVVAHGAVRVTSSSDTATAEELGVEEIVDQDERDKRAANPFYRLEKGGGTDAGKKPWLRQLQEQRDADWEDDYDANAALRRLHRSKRTVDFVQRARNESKGIRVPVGQEDDPADLAVVSAAPLGSAKRRIARSEGRQALLSGSIFGASAPGEDVRLQLLKRKRDRSMTFRTPSEGSRPRGAARPAPSQPSNSRVPSAATVAAANEQATLRLVEYSDSE